VLITDAIIRRRRSRHLRVTSPHWHWLPQILVVVHRASGPLLAKVSNYPTMDPNDPSSHFVIVLTIHHAHAEYSRSELVLIDLTTTIKSFFLS